MPKEGFMYEPRCRGFYGIGIENYDFDLNVGSLLRTSQALHADFTFTIGNKYKHQISNTCRSELHTPMYFYKDFWELFEKRPMNCELVGVELDARAKPIENFCHPPRCIYILGSESKGLSKDAIKSCRYLIKLPTRNDCGPSLNVAATGSMVLWDRHLKMHQNYQLKGKYHEG